MRFNGEFWEGTTANTATHGEGLTLAKLRAAIASIPPLPPTPKIDLYCHDLEDVTQVYEITDKTFAMPEQKYRRFLIVPRTRLESIADTLKRSGCDVRIEPRYGRPAVQPNSEQS